MSMPETPPNEFVRVIKLEGARPPRVRFAIDATPTECAALARRFGLVQLDRLSAKGQAELGSGGQWRLTGILTASVVQNCVVSLEPVSAEVEESFELDFTAKNDDDEDGEVDLTVGDAEPLPADGRLDVGEITAQQLSLALDPFPRKPGVQWEETPAPEDVKPGDRVQPFKDLADRLGRREET